MNALKGSLIGLISGLFITTSAGAVIGGIGRAAPCGHAPDFASGAAFGAFAFGVLLGPPVGLIAALAGGVVGWFYGRAGTYPGDQSRPRWTIGLVMNIIAVLGVALAMLRWLLPGQ